MGRKSRIWGVVLCAAAGAAILIAVGPADGPYQPGWFGAPIARAEAAEEPPPPPPDDPPADKPEEEAPPAPPESGTPPTAASPGASPPASSPGIGPPVGAGGAATPVGGGSGSPPWRPRYFRGRPTATQGQAGPTATEAQAPVGPPARAPRPPAASRPQPAPPPPSYTPEQAAADRAAATAATNPDRVFTLDNGLTVVMKRDPAQPVVAVQMYYKVGARHETIGVTGIAHYLEHMLFRGSDHFGPADVTGVIERAGGEWHGYTWLDGTTYFEAAPAALLPTLLRLEADRMTLARMASNEVEPERGAVFQEYRGYQLNPRSDLFDAVMAILYLQHPYRNNTMGWESDLAGITHADLVDFYRRYYGPRNAVLSIAGDVDLDAAEREVRRIFGEIPARGESVATRTVEPPIEGTRRVTLKRADAKRALLMSWHAPAATRPREYAALMLLDAVLARPRGLSFEHHSGDLTEGLEVGPAGRLHAVVDRGPAESLGTAYVPMVYPGHYSIYATLKPGRTTADLEKSINEALRAAHDLPDGAIDQARRLIFAADSVETDSPLEVAHEMAFWTALGGPQARRAVLEALTEVTTAEVETIARGLTPERAAIGWLLPLEGTGKPAASTTGDARPAESPLPGRGLCLGSGWSDAIEPATIPEVSSGSLRSDDGMVLSDLRPGLTTFALRVAIAAPDAGRRHSILNDLRGMARALSEDRRAAADAAAVGVSMSIVGPGEGRFDERDTLQIEMTGPAIRVAAAMRILESALPAALGTPTAPRAAAESPEEIALEVLEQSLNITTTAGRGSVAPPAEKGAGAPATYREIHNPARPRFFFSFVGPVKGAFGRRMQDLAGCVLDTLAPDTSHYVDSRAAASAGASPAPGGSPFTKPGNLHAAAPGVVQGRLLVAIPGDTDPVVQDAVAWLLHHNYGGRLGVAAIGETGLVYEMESESTRRGAPLAWFSMGADPEKLVTLTRVLNSVIDTVVRDGFFTDAEIASYRSYAAGRAAVRLAHPDQAARYWMSILLRGGDHNTPKVEAARAAALEGEEVREAARRMLATAGRLTVTVGQRQVR